MHIKKQKEGKIAKVYNRKNESFIPKDNIIPKKTGSNHSCEYTNDGNEQNASDCLCIENLYQVSTVCRRPDWVFPYELACLALLLVIKQAWNLTQQTLSKAMR